MFKKKLDFPFFPYSRLITWIFFCRIYKNVAIIFFFFFKSFIINNKCFDLSLINLLIISSCNEIFQLPICISLYSLVDFFEKYRRGVDGKGESRVD